MIQDRRNKSLCEKSMDMVVSIIRMSSFSISKMSLGASGPPAGTKSPAPKSVADKQQLRQSTGSKMSEKPKSNSKPISLLMQAGGKNEASILIENVKYESDEMFADYIRKVREKNRREIKLHPSSYIRK